MALSVTSSWLSHPLTRGLSIDDPRTTELRRRIIREKPFLRKIYIEWYRFIAAAIPNGTEPALELGSGAGFLDEFVPRLITSEVFPCAGVKMVLDGQSLPFGDASLRAIVMTDVLHHIRQPRAFLSEAARCVRPGGAVVLVEPWVTTWSRWVYTRFHHEPFEPQSADWDRYPARMEPCPGLFFIVTVPDSSENSRNGRYARSGRVCLCDIFCPAACR